MDFFKLLVTLPHHSKMGMGGLLISVPTWEAKYGPEWSSSDLLACAEGLEARANANTGVEWGDIRSRSINYEQAGFLRRVVADRFGG
jgi:hypothetical protein